jgi:aspartyl/glutamyl-tRNA(Asn/Gln) amidotransferase B subunit
MVRVKVGLEIHAQLKARSKLFSPLLDHVNSLDIATPGILPQVNMECVEKGIAAALLLNCQVNKWSRFDRKHYFYPDLPLGYQITQFYHPLAHDGRFENIRIDRLQLEQDTAKRDGHKWDFRRAGVALVEIVTKPDISGGEEASHFCWKLSKLLKDYNVSSGCLEDGSLRVDLNVSLHEESSDRVISPRCEIKNVNGFKYINRAIDLMVQLQMQKAQEPGELDRRATTWSFNQATSALEFLREKTLSNEYQYFPDPELTPLVVAQDFIDRVRGELANTTVMEDQKLANLFEKYPQAKDIYSFTDKSQLDWLCANYFGKYDLSTETLLGILRKVDEGTISFHQAKQILNNSFNPSDFGDSNDAVEFEKLITENSILVERYTTTKSERFLGPLIGQFLKQFPNTDPKKIKDQLIRRFS